jgi:peptide/nickel transport system substrate-binding protein
MCDPTSPTAAPYCKNNPGSGNPALRDPAVRTAIAWAIDRQTIVDKVLAGYGEPGTTIVPPFSSFYHWQPTADETIGFNLDTAKQMLADAGFKDTDNNGIVNDPKTGQDLNLRLILRSQSDVGARLGTYITGWLKQIGIATTSEVVGDGKLVSAWLDNDYDLYVWGWGPDPDPDFILSTSPRASAARGATPATRTPVRQALHGAADRPEPAGSAGDRVPDAGSSSKGHPRSRPVLRQVPRGLQQHQVDGLEDNISPHRKGSCGTNTRRIGADGAVRGRTRLERLVGLIPARIVGILGAIIVVVGIVMIARRGKSDEDLA